MANHIRNFQTIARYEANLRQPHDTIVTLSNVLTYIKSVLDDDSTQTLFEMIGHHLATQDPTAHHLNLDLMSDQIIGALQYAFVSVGVFSNERAQQQQMVDFFRDIYDGSGLYAGSKILSLGSIYNSDQLIPTNYTNFVSWLISNPQIYESAIPTDYEAFRIGLTLRLAREWFRVNHDTILEVHANSITGKLTQLLAVSKVQPVYWVIPSTFDYSPYSILALEDYDRYMALIEARLQELGGGQIVIDYTTYPDTAILPLILGYDESTIVMEAFFRDIYVNELGVRILQFDIESMKILSSGGSTTYEGFTELCADCGEELQLIGRKFLDYYVNHLTYVLTDNMTPEYRDLLTQLRGNVNTNYNKVYHVATVLNQNNFGIYTTLTIDHLVENRTLDLLNVVGLSKSICCLYLEPYHDVYGTLFNRLAISFDNYNPAFTQVLIEQLTAEQLQVVNLIITMSLDNMTVHINSNELVTSYDFPNSDRMFDVAPFFLFVGPRVDNYKADTTRISSIKLYGKALSSSDAEAILAGFQHT